MAPEAADASPNERTTSTPSVRDFLILLLILVMLGLLVANLSITTPQPLPPFQPRSAGPRPQPRSFAAKRNTVHFDAVAQLDARLRAENGKDGLRCSDEYGVGMLAAWRSAHFTLCSPMDDRERSSGTCYVRHAFGSPRYACVMHKSQLRDLSPPDFHPRYDAQCSTAMRDIWLRDLWLKSINENDQYQPLPMKDLHGLPSLPQCTSYVNHTVIWVPRWDGTNVYHSFEDLITIYQTLMVTGDDPKDVEIAWYGIQTNKPLDKMVFAAILPRLFRGARVLRDIPFRNGTCFKRSIFGVHGGVSQLSNNHGTRYCSTCMSTSPILRTFVDWMRNASDLPPRDAPQSPCATSLKSIVFISRRPPAKRILSNEAQLVAAIRDKLPPGWSIRAVQLEKVGNIIDQIRLAAKTSILVGTHGAGHMFSVFLPLGGASIEMFYSNKDWANQHYVNVDHLMGGTYHETLSPYGLGYNGPIDPARVLPQIEKVVKLVDSGKGCTQRIKVRNCLFL